MTKNKWIVLAVCLVLALLSIGGLVWFIKSVSAFSGIYYIVSVIVGFAGGWFLNRKWSEHVKASKKELLHD